MLALAMALWGCMPAFTLHGPPGISASPGAPSNARGAVQLAVGLPDLALGSSEAVPAVTLEAAGVARQTETPGAVQASLEGLGRLNVGPSGLPQQGLAVDPRVGLRGRLQWGPLDLAAEASGMVDFAPLPTGGVVGGTAAAAGLAGLRLGPVRLYAGAEAAAHWQYFAANLIMGWATEIYRVLLAAFCGVAVNLGPVTVYGTGGPAWNDSSVRHHDDTTWGAFRTASPPFAWMAGGGVRVNLAWFGRARP